MAITMVATDAQAAETQVTPNETPSPITGTTVNAHAIIDSVQERISETTSAPISDSMIGIDTTNADPEDDPADATSVTVDSNSANANATANDFTSTVDLAAVPTTLGEGDGAAALGVQYNAAPVSASVADDDGSVEIYARVGNFASGTATVTDNAIGSTAIGNNGTTQLAGEVLPDYESATAGSSDMTFNVPTADWLDADGGLVASTLQMQAPGEGPISDTALTSQANVQLSILNTDEDSTVAGSATLADNAVAATVAGNSSKSAIDLSAGGVSTLAGSAVVSNGQINASNTAAGSAITATNQDAVIVATVAADGDISSDDAELRGSLAVTGNAITSSASGNQALGTAEGEAGNRIVLADGASFQGSGDVDGAGADIAYNSGSVTSSVDADLIIHNSQGSVGAGNEGRLAVTASTDDGSVAAVVNDIAGGSVAVSGNEITGTANGNAASSALAGGADMASFAGSAALANQQNDYFTNVLAESTGDIYAAVADDDDLSDSTVSVDGNRVAAKAYGNSVSQDLSLQAAVQNLPLSGVTLTGGTGPDGNVSAAGSLTVTNLQANYNSDVDAREVHNIYADVSDPGDAVDGSSVAVTGNTGEAIAVGNSGANSLAVAGTGTGAISGGAGIASVQILDDSGGDDGDETDVSASSTGIAQVDSPTVDSSTLELSGNLQRGVAYGGMVTNTLSVSAEAATIDGAIDDDEAASDVDYDFDADRGLALTNGDLPVVDAAHGVLNVQSLNGDVAAQAGPAGWTDLDASFAVTVDGDVTGGTVVNGGHLEDGVAVGGNALVAAAYGADATNAAAFDVGTVTTSDGDFASAMNLTNVQEVTDNSDISAQAAGGAAVYTEVSQDNDVEDSSISTSYNTVQALAFANRAANSVTAGGTNIDTEADFFPIRGEIDADEDGTSTEASFSVNNAQVAGGDISATLLDTLEDEDADSSAAVITAIGGEITASSVVSNGNALSSGATGNRADNALTLAGNGLATTSAVSNYQVVSEEADIVSAVGTLGGIQSVEVDPGTADTPFNFAYEIVLTGSCGDGSCTGVTGVDRVLADTLAADEQAALLDADWVLDEGYLERPTTAAITPTMTDTDFTDVDGSTDVGSGTVLGVPPTFEDMYVPGSGGVTIAVGGAIEAATLSVNGNTTAGSVTGNSASNALTVSGTGIEDGSDHLLTYGTVDEGDAEANGDHMLVNRQFVDDDTDLTSDVNGTFAIDVNDGVVIGSSTLAVDGNGQSSRAVANTADNSVELTADNTAAGAVLVSSQDGEGDVEANSNLDIYTPVASLGSQVSMSGNTNLALGVMNDVTNTLTVDANSANPVTNPIDAIADVDFDAVAYGDHVLVNQQYAEDSVDADAATTIANQDLGGADSSGIFNGSVTVSGNSTMAEASANRAVNMANASAGASLGAAVGVTNSQISDSEVTSTAMTTAGTTLASDFATVPALNGGSITVGDNTTTALARGNAATNALNYAAGANYGTGTGDPARSSVSVNGTDYGVDGFAVAQAAVLNAQVNADSVTASATDATYGVVLNGSAGSALANGTVAVTGNAVSAAAYGNSATNRLAVNALNTGAPTAAVGNYQVNSGNVTASATSVSFGFTGGGTVTGSSLRTVGNQISATAVGNSAVSAITGQ